MKSQILSLFFAVASLPSFALFSSSSHSAEPRALGDSVAENVDILLDSFDLIISHRDNFWQQKLSYIQTRQTQAAEANNLRTRLDCYHDISQAYYVTEFDSAMHYADLALQVALQLADSTAIHQHLISKAELLAFRGMYSEADELLSHIDEASLSDELRFAYLITAFRVNQYRADYLADDTYAPPYREHGFDCLRRAMPLLSTDNAAYDYYAGEYNIFIRHDEQQAMRHYHRAVERLPQTSRLYAMSCFALASNYRSKGATDLCTVYLTRAAISDLINSSKEGMALQDLAEVLFASNPPQLERAQRYVNIAMADAQRSNNRLRTLDIARKSPDIILTYQSLLSQQNRSLRFALWGFSLLAVLMVALIVFIVRQNSLLGQRRHALAESNSQLSNLNTQLGDLNAQLADTNGRLVQVNKRRESLAKVYIDLCATYIHRLERFQLLVQRKIKAKQTSELLSAISSQRLSAEENAAFMHRFDKTFLELYPTFVDEFNALLFDGEQITLPHSSTLTTELRIFALIRLGVKESSEIAALLQFAPRTVYNYRSAFKTRVRNREQFEQQVAALCRES